ncbi:MAG: hypothetical protein DRI65_16655 [Chloroflexota bacterium]|nr:MAG: hypothetical protein DRI65_16655 [Chloroflexota bacterium]
MAATILINRLTGAGPTQTNITSVNTRGSTSDNPYTTETTNPIPIPTAGTNFSYWLVTQLNCTALPTGTVDAIKWYTDGTNSFGTGVACKVATANVYDQAGGTTGTTGTELTVANYGNGTTDLDGAPVDAFGKTSAAPLSVTGSVTSAGSTGLFADRVVYQYGVISTASPGTTIQETISWQYDET